MDKQLMDLLNEMNKEMKSMNTDIQSLKSGMGDVDTDIRSLKSEMGDVDTDIQFLKSEMGNMDTNIQSLKLETGSMNTSIHLLKSEMHNRFDGVETETKLQGVGQQFEQTNESRIDEVEFVVDKMNKIEKNYILLKSRNKCSEHFVRVQ